MEVVEENTAQKYCTLAQDCRMTESNLFSLEQRNKIARGIEYIAATDPDAPENKKVYRLFRLLFPEVQN